MIRITSLNKKAPVFYTSAAYKYYPKSKFKLYAQKHLVIS